MKKIYTFAKQATVAVAIMFGSFVSTQAFGQSNCGPIVENFNNSGGGFTGDLSWVKQGQTGDLEKSKAVATTNYYIITPTYQLSNISTAVQFGFLLSGSSLIGSVNVTISYVSTSTGQLTNINYGTYSPGYDVNGVATLCESKGITALPDFPVGGRYRFTFQITPNTGTGKNTDVIQFDDFRTNGTLSQITLPVTFIGFDAKKVVNGVQLSWQTADVDNVNHYEVERSSDGHNFASIASVALSKNNSYSYLDVNAGGTVYYRVKNVDNDGKFKFSSIARIANGLSSIVMNAFPQPAASRLTVQHTTVTNNALFTLSTVDGRVVSTIRPVAGSMQTMVDLSKLQSGLYLLRFNDGAGNTETMKVVKQ